MLDIDQLRTDTPGCTNVAHLNNCGSSLPPRPIVDAMVDYLRAEELGGGYEVAAARQDDLDRFYTSTAEYLGADPNEVAFVTGAADGWWRAFLSVPLAAGDRILVNSAEYQANAFGWMSAQRRGVEVVVAPNDAEGVTDVDALSELVDERVKLVSFTMISLANGGIQPAAEAAAAVRATGCEAFFLLDACQAAGQLPLDVGELGCDGLVYTGRKFMRGPRGTGALWVGGSALDRLDLPLMIDGHSATWTPDNRTEPMPGSQRFEMFETNFAGKVGLAVATEYMLSVGIDAIAQRVTALAERMRSQLASVPTLTVHDTGRERCGIVTFTSQAASPAEMDRALSEARINVSTPIRTAAQLDLGARGIDQVVRAGIHAFNTETEIDRACEVVESVIRSAR